MPNANILVQLRTFIFILLVVNPIHVW